MKPDLIDTLEPLTWLIGTWEGQGSAKYPTHEDFKYEDCMMFKLIEQSFDKEPLIHFEEIAWVVDKDEKEFKHWETGYFKPESNGSIQLYVCHNTGRIEITYGSFNSIDSTSKSFEIEFNSESIRNDQGTKTALKSKRRLILMNGNLNYELAMATTDVKKMTDHLECQLLMQ